MSTTSSMEASMQPKFKCCVFESDKDSKSFLTWLRLISGIIRNMLGGSDLEEFLDSYLNRGLHTSSTRPAFLGDPRLYFTPSASASSRPQQAREEDEDDSGEGVEKEEELMKKLIRQGYFHTQTSQTMLFALTRPSTTRSTRSSREAFYRFSPTSRATTRDIALL